MSCHHNAGHNHNIKSANKSIKNVAKLKYMRTNSNKSRDHSQRN